MDSSKPSMFSSEDLEKLAKDAKPLESREEKIEIINSQYVLRNPEGHNVLSNYYSINKNDLPKEAQDEHGNLKPGWKIEKERIELLIIHGK